EGSGRAAFFAASEPWSIVGREDHQRVLFDFEVPQRVENLAHTPIQFRNGIAVRTALRLPLELLRGFEPRMRIVMSEVEKERLIRGRRFADKLRGLFGVAADVVTKIRSLRQLRFA